MSNILDGYGSQFFPDQHVLARDLNMVGYTNTKQFRDYLKTITKMPGVVVSDLNTDASLQVITVDGTTFSVNQGVAIDGEGRVITLPTNPTTASGSLGSDPLYRPALPTRTSLSTGVTAAGTYYVNLKYIPLRGDTRGDDVGDNHSTRVYNSYIISVAAIRQDITLAQIQCDASGSITQDTTGNGYLNTNTGIYYAIYDDRPSFKIHDGRIGNLDTLTVNHTAELGEEIDKSIGFVYPTAGNVFYSKLPRNVNIDRLDLFCVGSSGGVTMYLYSGSTVTSLKLLGVVDTSPNVWTSHTLDLAYYSGHALKFEIASVTGDITACTASLVYTRR